MTSDELNHRSIDSQDKREQAGKPLEIFNLHFAIFNLQSHDALNDPS